MNINVRIFYYVNEIRYLYIQIKNWTEYDRFSLYADLLQFICILFQKIYIYENLNIFCIIFYFFKIIKLEYLNFLSIRNIAILNAQFIHGFISAFSSIMLFSLVFFLNLHCYWLYGFQKGLNRILGYQIGNLILIIIIFLEIDPKIWIQISFQSIRIILTSILFIRISYNTKYTCWKTWFFTKLIKYNQFKKLNLNLYLIFIIYRTYVSVEQRTLYRRRQNQILNTSNFFQVLAYFSYKSIILYTYRIGWIVRSRFMDLILLIITVSILEYILLKINYYLYQWTQKIYKWIRYLINISIYRIIPSYCIM